MTYIHKITLSSLMGDFLLFYFEIFSATIDSILFSCVLHFYRVNFV